MPLAEEPVAYIKAAKDLEAILYEVSQSVSELRTIGRNLKSSIEDHDAEARRLQGEADMLDGQARQLQTSPAESSFVEAAFDWPAAVQSGVIGGAVAGAFLGIAACSVGYASANGNTAPDWATWGLLRGCFFGALIGPFVNCIVQDVRTDARNKSGRAEAIKAAKEANKRLIESKREEAAKRRRQAQGHASAASSLRSVSNALEEAIGSFVDEARAEAAWLAVFYSNGIIAHSYRSFPAIVSIYESVSAGEPTLMDAYREYRSYDRIAHFEQAVCDRLDKVTVSLHNIEYMCHDLDLHVARIWRDVSGVKADIDPLVGHVDTDDLDGSDVTRRLNRYRSAIRESIAESMRTYAQLEPGLVSNMHKEYRGLSEKLIERNFEGIPAEVRETFLEITRRGYFPVREAS